MSRIFSFRNLPFLIILGLVPATLNAQVSISATTQLGKHTGEDSIIEFGLRAGPGFRSKDRFENNLENFTSTYQPGIFSKTKTDGFRNLDFLEGMVRMGFSDNQRFGFVFGSLNYNRANLTEVTSDGYLTRLNFDIRTDYLLLTYYFLWDLSKNWGLEAGLGFGGNETRWASSGTSASQSEYFPQSGKLRGSGISARLEASVNYRVNDYLFLQFGWMIGNHTVPSFSGSWNGKAATFYIREDGKTTPLTESRATDSIVLTNQFTRALDMNATYTGIYFSAILRFYY